MKDSHITKRSKITVFGVGTAGCSVLDVLAESDVGNEINLVAVDEKSAAFHSSKADVKIMLFKDEPVAFRPGPMPLSRARNGALEVYDQILDAMKQ